MHLLWRCLFTIAMLFFFTRIIYNQTLFLTLSGDIKKKDHDYSM